MMPKQRGMLSHGCHLSLLHCLVEDARIYVDTRHQNLGLRHPHKSHQSNADPATPPALPAQVKPGSLRIDSNSCLILDGDSITVEDLEVHGALVVRAAPGAKVAIRGLKVQNAGWEWRPLAEGEAAKEEEAIRGFRVVRNATAEFVFDKPGEYVLDGIAPA